MGEYDQGLATGIATAVVVAIELLALAMFMDWWLDLPWGVRLALLAAQFTVFSYIFLRMIVAPILRQPDEDELALMVEKARPEFHSRLIAAIQLTRPGAVPSGASTSLAEAMVEQTEAIANPIPFTKIVPTDKLKRIGALAIIVPVIAVVGMTSGRDVCLDLLKRAFLSNVPVPRNVWPAPFAGREFGCPVSDRALLESRVTKGDGGGLVRSRTRGGWQGCEVGKARAVSPCRRGGQEDAAGQSKDSTDLQRTHGH